MVSLTNEIFNHFASLHLSRLCRTAYFTYFWVDGPRLKGLLSVYSAGVLICILLSSKKCSRSR